MAETKKLKIKPILKSILISLVITFIFVLLLTTLCYFGNVSEKLLGFLIFLASAVSVFLSCLFMAKGIGEKGLIYGALSGFGYFAIIFVASVCSSGCFTPSTQSITMLLGSVLSGALGGVVGVNR